MIAAVLALAMLASPPPPQARDDWYDPCRGDATVVLPVVLDVLTNDRGRRLKVDSVIPEDDGFRYRITADQKRVKVWVPRGRYSVAVYYTLRDYRGYTSPAWAVVQTRSWC